MSARSNGQRIFILVIVGTFLISSLSLSFYVIYDMVANKNKQQTAASQTEDLQKQLEQLQAQGGCDIRTPIEGVKTKPAPEGFKPGADVVQLQTTDLTVGNGDEVKPGDCLVVKYHGTLAADGTKFDGNYEEPKALQFTFGQGNVIKGWDEGIIGMKVGGERRLVIPSDLGYGEQGAGQIPANADLVFVVELLEIKKQ